MPVVSDDYESSWGMLTNLGFLLEIEGIYFVELTFLYGNKYVSRAQGWGRGHYQLEEECGLVRLEGCLRVHRRGRAQDVILGG